MATTTPQCDSADDCSWCGRDLDGDAREVGPNRFACSRACADALEDAWCSTCESWIPDDGHCDDCPAVDPHERMLDAAWEEGRRAAE